MRLGEMMVSLILIYKKNFLKVKIKDILLDHKSNNKV